MLNRNLPSADQSHFSMVPRSDIPRSTFRVPCSYKSTFQTGYLIPFYLDEVLPGDVHKGEVTIFARLNTLLFPVMDNAEVETFFFFVPNRLVWTNWARMMGERKSPSDSISFTTPQIVSPAGGFAINSIYDYLGLPCVGQVTAGQTVTINALPLRCYDFIFDEWFKDQNLDTATSSLMPGDDGPDLSTAYALQYRRKKHDYFTSALPFPVKGGSEPNFPLAGFAFVEGIAYNDANTPTAGDPTGAGGYDRAPVFGAGAGGWSAHYAGASAIAFRANPPGLSSDPLIYADLSTTTGLALNAMRQAVATQQLLEKDMRGGTRYTELLQSHFGVRPEDSRLQRPEYIGGGRSRIQTQAIPQTAPTSGNEVLGGLAAQASVADKHSFSCYATEHGFIMGIVNVRADVTYQQGLDRMWTRLTRYDHYWPAFANLGEQALRNDEIYCTGTDATDVATFGYQERWAEYRYKPSKITGAFNSKHAGNIDEWHLAQEFTALPVLNTAFIEDKPPFSRVLKAGAAADNMQVLFDSVFFVNKTRALPVYSVPGLDRF